jgi:hypothetical protein
MMHEVGLIPSDTGQPGGKEVGQKVSQITAFYRHSRESGGSRDGKAAAVASGPRFRGGDGQPIVKYGLHFESSALKDELRLGDESD